MMPKKLYFLPIILWLIGFKLFAFLTLLALLFLDRKVHLPRRRYSRYSRNYNRNYYNRSRKMNYDFLKKFKSNQRNSSNEDVPLRTIGPKIRRNPFE